MLPASRCMTCSDRFRLQFRTGEREWFLGGVWFFRTTPREPHSRGGQVVDQIIRNRNKSGWLRVMIKRLEVHAVAARPQPDAPSARPPRAVLRTGRCAGLLGRPTTQATSHPSTSPVR